MDDFLDYIDASPSKRIYQSIIVDYDLNRSLCELIDNALDVWKQNGSPDGLRVSLTLDPSQQSICIEDNAGGVQRGDLRAIVSPGESRNKAEDDTIGFFGVGSKRSAVALAMLIRITTRPANEPFGFRLEYDEEWLTTEDNWQIALRRVDGFPAASTVIDLNKLRIPFNGADIDRLRQHLGETYCHFVRDKRLSLLLNMLPVEPIDFENWAFPPGYEPQPVKMTVQSDAGPVQVRMLGGLMKEASPSEGEYGVYVYCNDRLIARAIKTHEVGFVSGQAGKPHPSASLMRVILGFKGPSGAMPWTSNKSDLNTRHSSFRSIQPNLIAAVAHWATLSRRFAGEWGDKVTSFTTGEMGPEVLQEPGRASRSYLPRLPTKRPPRFSDVLIRNNSALRSEKPWASMALDSTQQTRRYAMRWSNCYASEGCLRICSTVSSFTSMMPANSWHIQHSKRA